MPMTSAQIVTIATQIAKAAGMTSQAGQLLNTILSELCQTYDFELARKTTVFNFTGTSGPYSLPSDFLRVRKGDVFYTYLGVPYFPTPVQLEEYDSYVTQAGLNDFPRRVTVDMNPSVGVGQIAVAPQMFFWPPPSFVAPVTVRYYAQMPDINQPELSTNIPWFPNQTYLIQRLAGQMMMITDDTRAAEFLTDKEEQNPQGAGVVLRKYLQMKDDPEGKINTVELDRRRFGTNNWNMLKNTKNIGW